MSQSRLASLMEAGSNIAVGYFIAVGAQMVIFPAHGIEVDMRTHFSIGLAFTVVSLVRSYVLRRIYNALTVRQQRKESGP